MQSTETWQQVFGLRGIYRAYRRCRVGKRSTRNVQRYEARLLDRLVATQQAFASNTWAPSRALAFVVSQPKAREIHAADFADRVVHHVLVDQLSPLYERVFIFDSYANRVGKGTHAAVDRLQQFLRSQTRGGNRAAFTLKLDIKNFFNSIHRPTLYRLLLARLVRDVRAARVDRGVARTLVHACRALLATDPAANVHRRGSAARFASVPAHKRLGAQGEGYGLPIGNLTSQFFANVYLNELDQFVKHTLKVQHYVRYVDDFVLVAPDAETLVYWREEIVEFLQTHLQLRLHEVPAPRRASSGVDFLGYVLRHSHKLVRARVVNNCKAALRAFEAAHLLRRPEGTRLSLSASAVRRLHATVASYAAHFSHAQSRRLGARLRERFGWLPQLFDDAFGTQGAEIGRVGTPCPPSGAAGKSVCGGSDDSDHATAAVGRGCPPYKSACAPLWWASRSASLAGDWQHFARQWPGYILLMQVGARYRLSNPHSVLCHARTDLSRVGTPCPPSGAAGNFVVGANDHSDHATAVVGRGCPPYIELHPRQARAIYREFVRAARVPGGVDAPGIVVIREFERAADGRQRRMLSVVFTVAASPEARLRVDVRSLQRPGGQEPAHPTNGWRHGSTITFDF